MRYRKEDLRESPLDEKCVWFERVYERVTRELKVVSGKLAGKVGSSELTEIETQLDDLEYDLEVIETKFEIAQLKIQYTASINLMISYKLIQQDSENPERYFYHGNYNGKGKEPDGKGKDFTGDRFDVPTFQTILSRLTPEKLGLIRKMKEEGLEPRLQLTPIAYTLETLARRIDFIKTGLNKKDTVIWHRIKEEELKYSPTSVKVGTVKESIEISGEMTRSAWIEAHNGFLVDIVAMKTELEPDLEIQKVAEEIETNVVQAEKYFEEMTKNGYSPMSYFSYLLAQMSAIQNGEPLDQKSTSLLLDSSLTIKNSFRVFLDNIKFKLPCGFWRRDGSYVCLFQLGADNRNAELRVRPSLRLF